MALIVWAAPLKWNCYHLGLFFSEERVIGFLYRFIIQCLMALSSFLHAAFGIRETTNLVIRVVC